MGTIVGSYETGARLSDEAATVRATMGIMLILIDSLKNIAGFGTCIQPPTSCNHQAMLAV